MISQNPAGSQASQLTDAKTGAADSVPLMDPGKPIEVAPSGDGTVTDPAAKDNKPPLH